MEYYSELKDAKKELESKKYDLQEDIDSVSRELSQINDKIKYLEESSKVEYQVGDYLICGTSYYYNEGEIDAMFTIMKFKGFSDFGFSDGSMWDEFDVLQLSISKGNRQDRVDLFVNAKQGYKRGSTKLVDGCGFDNYIICDEETAKYCIKRMKEIAFSESPL